MCICACVCVCEDVFVSVHVPLSHHSQPGKYSNEGALDRYNTRCEGREEQVDAEAAAAKAVVVVVVAADALGQP